jgi:hypothetical protein
MLLLLLAGIGPPPLIDPVVATAPRRTRIMVARPRTRTASVRIRRRTATARTK